MNLYKKLIIQILVIFINFCSSAQELTTIGVRYFNPNVSGGYTLFTPEKNNNVFLINNCGEVINKWEFTERPGATCYLLNNGDLLRAGKKSLEIRDWDNNIIWSFSMESIGNQHHDIEPLPNGNILCVVTDLYTNDEILMHGRKPDLIEKNSFKLDKIIEIKPLANNTAEVVWEWRFIDHLIQDFDDSKLNYGNVKDHPELIDINYYTENLIVSDFSHVNGIDYNKELDQILISARHLNEIYIIDHSTTTEEAKGNTGGNSKKGGTILWRWGNPQVYRQGTIENQNLYLQHDAKWVEKDYLDEGMISVFNNGGDGSGNYSSFHLLNPSISNQNYVMNNNKFLPLNFEWTWEGSILDETVLEGKKSGGHFLPNGNFIICETSKGQFSEINKEGEVLWVYKNPTGISIFNQNDMPTSNSIFRAEKYPVSFFNFSQFKIRPLGIIENKNINSEMCSESFLINEESIESLKFQNPVINGVLNFNKEIEVSEIIITNTIGVVVYKKNNFKGNRIETHLPEGVYFIKLKSDFIAKSYKILIL